MQGLLPINKPESWTSFDVVNYVRKIVAHHEGKKPRNIKVGHTGTLDPAATGLLIIAVGKQYTQQMPTLMKQDKTYDVELTIGKVSTTQDKEGEVTQISKEVPSREDIDKVLELFKGEIQQLPPAFSAIKVNGVRAYELARKGREVELKPRPVKIYEIANVTYEYPLLRFSAHVGSGTYIRSLARDIGEKLGTGAYMSALCRTSIGDVKIAQAYELSDLTEAFLEKTLVEK